jgi:hypothetical protein
MVGADHAKVSLVVAGILMLVGCNTAGGDPSLSEYYDGVEERAEKVQLRRSETSYRSALGKTI